MTVKIVTGVDGTEPAMQAARTAARLALALDGELYVVSAFGKVDTIEVHAEGHDFVVTPEQDALRMAQQTATRLQEEFPTLRMQAASAEGKPADALVDVAEELGADLIVVGNKRVQGLARVLGSIASEVARKAHCDVYIAHTHPRD
jgi:nucleotide-binding universal stress UspA family protein